jgi:hypothetical protein
MRNLILAAFLFLSSLGPQAALPQEKAQEAAPAGADQPNRVGDDVTRPEKISGAPPGAPIAYKIQLLGEKMKLTTDPQEREALTAEATRLLQLGQELRSRGAPLDPFAPEDE